MSQLTLPYKISLSDFLTINHAFYVHGQLPFFVPLPNEFHRTFEATKYLLPPQWYQLVNEQQLTMEHISECLQYIKQKDNTITKQGSLTPYSALAVAFYYLEQQPPSFLQNLKAKEKKYVLDIMKLIHQARESDFTFIEKFDLSYLDISERVELFVYCTRYKIKEPELLNDLLLQHAHLLKKRDMYTIGQLPWNTCASFVPYIEYCVQNNLWEGLQHINAALLHEHKDIIFQHWNNNGQFPQSFSPNITSLYTHYIEHHHPPKERLLALLNSLSNDRASDSITRSILAHYSMVESLHLFTNADRGTTLNNEHLHRVQQSIENASLTEIIQLLQLPSITFTANGLTLNRLTWDTQKKLADTLERQIEKYTRQPYKTTMKNLKITLKSLGQRNSATLLKTMFIQNLSPTQEIQLHM